MDDKAALRGKLRARRRALPREDRLQAAQAVCQLALTRPEIAGARRVMAYRAARGELDLDPLAAALAERGAVLYYPRVVADALEAAPAGAGFERGVYGIQEPCGEGLPPEALRLDLVLIPLVAMDRAGRRLGQGGGYYDRFLPRLPGAPLRVGVGYCFQLIDQVPAQAHDALLDALLTDQGWIPIERSSRR
ncbi:MAG: 5-formyltetrahydrofolate cyclo-ligase [Christensenellales bacterium]|jgi:5-formyltetrahydrofolate cyclo-ligase